MISNLFYNIIYTMGGDGASERRNTYISVKGDENQDFHKKLREIQLTTLKGEGQ